MAGFSLLSEKYISFSQTEYMSVLKTANYFESIYESRRHTKIQHGGTLLGRKTTLHAPYLNDKVASPYRKYTLR